MVPLVMLLLSAGLITIFAKITEEMFEGDLQSFDHAILLVLRHSGDPANSGRFHGAVRVPQRLFVVLRKSGNGASALIW